MSKKISIIGAGPGGLSAAMILSSKGYEVEIFEKRDRIGGRNSSFNLGDFKFDLGPTFFMMKYIMEEIFELSGKNIEEYIDFIEIDPLYDLKFKDKTFTPTRNEGKMLKVIEENFPGNSDGYLKYQKRERKKFDHLVPCLQVPYGKPSDFLKKRFLLSLPYLDAHKSLFNTLGSYFSDDDLKIAFTFQSKYIGMSPWKCPGTFSILSFIEHGSGIFHPVGGLNSISLAMAKAFEDDGGKIHLNSPVSEILYENDKASGVRLEDGREIHSDYVIMNVDFANGIKKLFPKEKTRTYTHKKIDSLEYSCSTFMLYLAVDKLYEGINHHNIVFADDYRKNVEDIIEKKILSNDFSFYVQNPCKTDNTLAPKGKSTLYVLVPVPNNKSGIDWHQSSEKFKESLIDMIEAKLGMADLRGHILDSKVINPFDWENEYDVYKGAVFNLSHKVSQMLYFRPHNEYNDLKGMYLVGGGTHPGSGLPTILESGRITANLIFENDKKQA